MLFLRLGVEHEFHDIDGSLSTGQMSRRRKVMLLRADEGAVVQTQFDCMYVTSVDCRVQWHVSLRVQHGPASRHSQHPPHPSVHVAVLTSATFLCTPAIPLSRSRSHSQSEGAMLSGTLTKLEDDLERISGSISRSLVDRVVAIVACRPRATLHLAQLLTQDTL